MLADTPTSPVDETPQPTSGEALLRRVRTTRRRAQVLRAAARAARQRAKAVQEYTRHYNTLACAARVVRRYLITHLHSHASVRSTTLLPMRHVPPLAGRANQRQRSMGGLHQGRSFSGTEPARGDHHHRGTVPQRDRVGGAGQRSEHC
jgi:hypothetical protein